MSKIGNHVVGIQESEDYQWGWETAERGWPEPEWETPDVGKKLAAQRLGWSDFHRAEQST